MADISLKEYLEKVEVLLKTGKSDEVILHARQILKHYPRNAAANRFLGQALLEGTDFREAEPVLRQVLAVYPDDVAAHTALSDLNERLGKPDEAIWHLERALEGAPNHPPLLDKLRSLYQRHRDVENPHFQLTTAGVARQYVRNGLYDQAIETLQTTLEQSPRRADLRLLLAQTMWTAGMQVEAAETALDVLDTLPYCLEANRILTLLWLGEGRPSDAQRYLNQIQEVEPYLALQLVQNAPPPDDAFTLPELDYRRIAETQIATEQPDWLSEIGEEALPADTITDLADEIETDFEALTDDEMPADFLTELEDADESAPALASGGTGYTGLLAALDQPDDADDEPIVAEELPDWLTAAAPVTAVEEPEDNIEADPLDWLAVDDEEPSVEDQAASDLFADTEFAETAAPDTGVHDEVDPLAWLEGSGVELRDDSEPMPATNFFDDDEMEYQDPDAVDRLAWLQGSNAELTEVGDESAGSPDLADTSSLDWLESSQSGPLAEPADAAGQTTLDADSDASLDWLQEQPEPEKDTGDLESLLENAQPMPAEDDNLDWLSDDSILEEILDIEALGASEEPNTISSIETENPDQPAAVLIGEDSTTSITDVLPGSQETEEEDWQSEMNDQFRPESQPEDSDESRPEWQSETAEPEATEPDAGALEWMNEIEDEEADWLQAEPDEIADEVEPDAQPDWLIEEPAEDEAVASEFSWLDEEQPDTEPEPETSDEQDAAAWSTTLEEEAEAEPVAAMPDWLAEAAPTSEDAVEMAETGEPASEAAFDWLSGEDEEPAAEPNAEIPDWLSEAAPSTEDAVEMAEAGEPASEATFDWLSSEDESEQVEEAAADAAEWLSEVTPTTEDAVEMAEAGEPASEAAFDWLSGEDEEPAAEPNAEIPDWLSEAAPSTEDAVEMAEAGEPESEATFDWLSGEDEEQVAEVTSDTPAWLEDLTPTAEQGESEPVDEEEPAAEPAADIPDWLSEAAPTSEEMVSAVEEAEPQSEETFDWFAQEEEEVVTDTPDWLENLTPADEAEEPAYEQEAVAWSEDAGEAAEAEVTAQETAEPADEAVPAASLAQTRILPENMEDYDWPVEAASEELSYETDPARSEFGWLEDVSAADSAEEEDVQPLSDAEFEQMVDDEEKILASAPAPPPADNAPDWLNAMVPGLDLDYEAIEDDKPIETTYDADTPLRREALVSPAEEEQLAQGDYDWVADIVDEETSPIQPVSVEPGQPVTRQRFVFSRPPVWLRTVTESGQEESSETDDDFELPDWLR